MKLCEECGTTEGPFATIHGDEWLTVCEGCWRTVHGGGYAYDDGPTEPGESTAAVDLAWVQANR